MNYANFIVKIIEKPVEMVCNNKISVIKLIAELPNSSNENFEKIQIFVWKNFSEKILQSFFVGDFIIIEGYISLTENNYNNKSIEISVFKLYPF